MEIKNESLHTCTTYFPTPNHQLHVPSRSPYDLYIYIYMYVYKLFPLRGIFNIKGGARFVLV